MEINVGNVLENALGITTWGGKEARSAEGKVELQ